MDDVDRANEWVQKELDDLVATSRKFKLDPGVPGDCDLCGEWSGRLIRGICAPCRDRWHLR
jgi:hypothetical protein